LRVFTPGGETPKGGWPVMLYFHGGGWVLGNINTENPVCTNLCVRGNCVVVTVDYRYTHHQHAIK
jgi:triacylglycerol lipase